MVSWERVLVLTVAIIIFPLFFPVLGTSSTLESNRVKRAIKEEVDFVDQKIIDRMRTICEEIMGGEFDETTYNCVVDFEAIFKSMFDDECRGFMVPNCRNCSFNRGQVVETGVCRVPRPVVHTDGPSICRMVGGTWSNEGYCRIP